MLNVGTLICEGVVVHRGRQLVTSEVLLKDEAGKLYAHATTICTVFPISRPEQ